MCLFAFFYILFIYFYRHIGDLGNIKETVSDVYQVITDKIIKFQEPNSILGKAIVVSSKTSLKTYLFKKILWTIIKNKLYKSRCDFYICQISRLSSYLIIPQIHELPDDYGQPVGNAGPRLGCCIIDSSHFVSSGHQVSFSFTVMCFMLITRFL